MGATVNTHSAVERPGVYVCTTCYDTEQVLREGDVAPTCEYCKRPVTWERRKALQRIGFNAAS